MGKLLIIVAVAVSSGVTGGVVSWLVARRSLASAAAPETEGASHEAAPKSAEAAEHKDEAKKGSAEEFENWAALPLEPFVVNLADHDASRYLRIKVSLMLDSKAELEHIKENQALQLKLRDRILQLLTQKASKDLVSDEGKNKLRDDIRGKVGSFFTRTKLVDVMFTEFVIQL
jgi:flagellar FliL protein